MVHTKTNIRKKLHPVPSLATDSPRTTTSRSSSPHNNAHQSSCRLPRIAPPSPPTHSTMSSLSRFAPWVAAALLGAAQLPNTLAQDSVCTPIEDTLYQSQVFIITLICTLSLVLVIYTLYSRVGKIPRKGEQACWG